MLNTHSHSHGGGPVSATSHDSYYEARRRAVSSRTIGGTDAQTRAAETPQSPAKNLRFSLSETSASKGRQAAALCVTAAAFGLGTELINELIAYQNKQETLPLFGILACGLGLTAIAFAAYAQKTQARQRSRRVHRRLLIGFPLALLALVSALPGLVKRSSSGNASESTPASQAVPPPPRANNPPAHLDNALTAPGWYGEKQQDGILLVITSFAENTVESARFNGRLAKPASYATFSIVNLGRATPIVVNRFQAKVHLDDGTTVSSLEVGALLKKNDALNKALAERLSAPQKLAVGGMLADLPLCLEKGFPWSRATSVTLTVDSQEITVTGRLLTSEEKGSLLKRGTDKRSSATTQGTVESWFKDL